MGCGASNEFQKINEVNGRKNKEIEQQIRKERIAAKKEIKLLLLGTGESGKSTIVKQMRIIHLKGFTAGDYEYFSVLIRINIIQSMAALCRATKLFSVEFSSTDREVSSKLIIKIGSEIEIKGNVTQNEFEKLAPPIADLWKDPAIQICYSRASEFQLPDCAKHFLDEIERISRVDYQPSTGDILRARVKTTGITEIQFPIKGMIFRMFDVGGQRSERKKWIHCFDDVMAVIYCVAISEYDQVLIEDNRTNRMVESIRLFEAIANNHFFFKTSMILFLNKKDLFEQKIKTIDLTCCFPNYTGLQEYTEASDYIKHQFKMVNRTIKREIYVHKTCATDTQNIEYVFDAVSDVIIANNLQRAGLVE